MIKTLLKGKPDFFSMVEMSIERERFVCVCLCVCLFLCMRVCVCSTCCRVFYMNHPPVKLRGHWKNLLYFSISVFLISWIVVTTTVAGGLRSAFANLHRRSPASVCGLVRSGVYGRPISVYTDAKTKCPHSCDPGPVEFINT